MLYNKHKLKSLSLFLSLSLSLSFCLFYLIQDPSLALCSTPIHSLSLSLPFSDLACVQVYSLLESSVIGFLAREKDFGATTPTSVDCAFQECVSGMGFSKIVRAGRVGVRRTTQFEREEKSGSRILAQV